MAKQGGRELAERVGKRALAEGGEEAAALVSRRSVAHRRVAYRSITHRSILERSDDHRWSCPAEA